MFFRLNSTLIFILFSFFCITQNANSAELSYYLPEETYKGNVPKPSDILGFEVGSRHARHDQLVSYFNTLSTLSDRVSLKEMGLTNQYRKQLLVTISHPKNIQNLDAILANRSHEKTADQPLVVWLGYSVHGDEISGANASMIAAYYYAASQNPEIEKLLENVIIVMEPSINPDGMDRFVNWVTTFRDETDNADPNHIEHHQHWPSGRTNHYWFDLNRDWLLLSQKESQNRLKYFHQYQPNVLGDFHEMGANSSYFFQPGIPSRTNPITPKENIELTREIAKFHAKALDKEERLYYSEESFDDFYYGKGSTYPDINGSIGILFEQASSRGYQQDTINGLLTFEFGIKNHVLTSLSTVEGAWKNKARLQSYRQNFYTEAINSAKKEKFSGYLISENSDHYRLNAFLDKLAQHQIDVYPLAKDFLFKSTIYKKEHSYFIPLEQRQYRLVKALFTTQTNFEDNTFYDVSGWTMPLAMDLNFEQVGRTWGLKLANTPWSKAAAKQSAFKDGAYAYAFEWQNYLAPKMLNALLSKGIEARVATKRFSSQVNNSQKSFKAGTIVIPAGIQKVESWRNILQNIARENSIPVFAIATGLTPTGIDIGSNSFDVLEKANVMLIGGKGISQYEAGEMRYYIEGQLNISVSVIEHPRVARVDLSQYSHIVMVDGNYDLLSESAIEKLQQWIKDGGVIIAQKRATRWLSSKEILKVNVASKAQLDQLFDTSELTYQDKEKLGARKRIAGAIFNTDLDTSHPLGYGFTDNKLPLFRNSTIIMNTPTTPFITVAKYSKFPLMSGYTDKNLVNRIGNNAAIVAHNVGQGRVIATSDNLAFRGYWLGSAKVIANSLFFAKAFSANVKK